MAASRMNLGPPGRRNLKFLVAALAVVAAVFAIIIVIIVVD